MGSRVKTMTQDAMLVAIAMLCSYLEGLIPLPVAGLKLGLANLIVLSFSFCFGMLRAGRISLVRVTLSAVLFGTPISFLFSFAGALSSFLALWILRRFAAKAFSEIGISILCAAFHHIGQIAAGAMLYGGFLIFTQLPLLLLLSVLTGGLIGALGLIVEKRICFIQKGRSV